MLEAESLAVRHGSKAVHGCKPSIGRANLPIRRSMTGLRAIMSNAACAQRARYLDQALPDRCSSTRSHRGSLVMRSFVCPHSRDLLVLRRTFSSRLFGYQPILGRSANLSNSPKRWDCCCHHRTVLRCTCSRGRKLVDDDLLDENVRLGLLRVETSQKHLSGSGPVQWPSGGSGHGRSVAHDVGRITPCR